MNIEMLTPLMVQGYRRKRGRRAKPKPISPSRRVELWYTKELLAISNICKAEANTVLNNLKSHSRFVGDSFFETHWDKVKSGNIDMLYIKIDTLALQLAGTLVRKEQDDVDKQLTLMFEQLTTINISSILTDEGLSDVIEDAISANVGLIKSIPRRYFEKMESIINNGFQNGYTYNQIQEEIFALGESTDARAKFIARDQIGKLNSQFDEARQTELGVEEYEWSTSGDERVRSRHAEMDGKIVRWDKPPSFGHAGIDYQCRCTRIPVLDKLLNKRKF